MASNLKDPQFSSCAIDSKALHPAVGAAMGMHIINSYWEKGFDCGLPSTKYTHFMPLNINFD